MDTVSFDIMQQGLKWLAGILPYSNPENFEDKATVLLYMDIASSYKVDKIRETFVKIAKKEKEFPAPATFKKYLDGVEDCTGLAYEILEEINHMAKYPVKEAPSSEAYQVLQALGVASYELKYKVGVLEKITKKAVTEVIQAKNIKRTQNKVLLADKQDVNVYKPKSLKKTHKWGGRNLATELKNLAGGNDETT